VLRSATARKAARPQVAAAESRVGAATGPTCESHADWREWGVDRTGASAERMFFCFRDRSGLGGSVTSSPGDEIQRSCKAATRSSVTTKAQCHIVKIACDGMAARTVASTALGRRGARRRQQQHIGGPCLTKMSAGGPKYSPARHRDSARRWIHECAAEGRATALRPTMRGPTPPGLAFRGRASRPATTHDLAGP